jgi:pimeloyl-ACP methyl ester carboxylesterase
MSYTPPYSNFVANLGSVHYGLVHLGLATVVYTYEDSPLSLPPQLAAAITALPAIPDISGSGYWSLDWGPAFCTNTGGLYNDNLIAVISYRLGQPGSGTPCFFAVACRGTDAGGGIGQISEDLDAFVQQPWLNVLNGSYIYGGATSGMAIQSATSAALPSAASALVATGSADALIAISNLVQYDQVNSQQPVYLINALQNLLASYPGTPVVVTGHSLGGALTQVVAAYLNWQLSGLSVPPPVIPHAFAPPTVGDPNFAAYYNGLFGGGSQFWLNANDLVPTAFSPSTLTDAGGMWGTYSWPDVTPDFWGPTIFGTGATFADHLKLGTAQSGLISTFAKYLPVYARPANVQSMPASSSKTLPTQTDMMNFLTAEGGNPNAWNTWGSVVMYQHLTPTYYQLVSAVNEVMAYPEVKQPATPPLGNAAIQSL